MNKSWLNRKDPLQLIEQAIKATYAKDEEHCDRRRHRRVKSTGSVTTNLGKVLDISSGGLRVLSKTKAEGQGHVELITPINRVVVPSRVVWCHKVGFRKYVMGLEFINLTPELTQMVTEIATAP